MGKIGGLALAAALALTACAPAQQPVEQAAAIQIPASAQSAMLAELRPLLTTLQASDAGLLSEGYGACMSLVFQSKDKYREEVMKQYADVRLAVDHLTVAAAAKQYLCR